MTTQTHPTGDLDRLRAIAAEHRRACVELENVASLQYYDLLIEYLTAPDPDQYLRDLLDAEEAAHASYGA